MTPATKNFTSVRLSSLIRGPCQAGKPDRLSGRSHTTPKRGRLEAEAYFMLPRRDLARKT